MPTQYTSGSRSYAANPFAVPSAPAAPGAPGAPIPGPADQGRAYVDALRNYGANPFEAANPTPPMKMAPHLAQGPRLDPETLEAYRYLSKNQPDPTMRQIVPDVDRLWRVSPSQAMFQPGYQHHQVIGQRIDEMRQQARRAAILAQGGDPDYQPEGGSTAM